MRLSTLIGGNTLVLLLISLSSCALLLWHVEQSRHWALRLQLAQASYHEHQALQSNIYQLLKQHGDAMLIGDRDAGAMEAELEASIASNVSAIRDLIAQEIQLEGGEEVEELTLLARIERKVQQLTEAMTLFTADGRPLDMEERRALLVRLLDQEIDVELSGLITSALEGERDEVLETRAAAVAFRDRISVVTVLIASLALAFTVGAGFYYQSAVGRPLRRLMDGVSAYGAGRFDQPVEAGGAKEFGQMGQVLSTMARDLGERELTRQQQTEQLERAVQARTVELGEANAELRVADERRRRFLADVSHELRTPLAAIRGEADVTLRARDGREEDYRTALGRISEQATLSAALVDDLLFMARADGGAPRLRLQPVSLPEVARRAAADIAVLAREHDVRLDIEADEPVDTVQGDPSRLRQLVVILLDNAIRYSRPGGVVEVRVATGPAGVVLQVSDHGLGIPENELNRIFDRFFRGGAGGEAHQAGSGLGLAMAVAIVKAHGAAIAVDSRPDEGSTFGVAFPSTRRMQVVK